jgi:hypothetical protein
MESSHPQQNRGDCFQQRVWTLYRYCVTDETKEQAERRKAAADANAAETSAAKAAREEREATTPAAIAQRSAKAEDEAAKAARDRLSALVPDFTKITRGDLTVASGGEPAAGTGVGSEAILDAARHVVEKVIRRLGSEYWSILVTEDVDLASSDAVYQDVMSSLERLTKLADETLKATEKPSMTTEKPSMTTEEPSTDESRDLGLVPVATAMAALATAIPGVISSLSAPKTVTTGTIAFDDTAASMAVAGELKGNNDKRHVFHDRFRPLPTEGPVLKRVDQLRNSRESLALRKLELDLKVPSDQSQDHIASDIAVAIALVTKVIGSIDAYLELLNTIPAGATRSPFTTAVLRQGLHDPAARMKVLLVKAQSASAMQAVANHLIKNDRFAVLGAASITWSLINPQGEIMDAGIVTGTAQATGTIGESFALTPLKRG